MPIDGVVTGEHQVESPRCATCHLLSLPKELRLSIIKLIVQKSLPSVKRDKSNSSDDLVSKAVLERRCAQFVNMPMMHSCSLIRYDAFHIINLALNGLGQDIAKEVAIWDDIATALERVDDDSAPDLVHMPHRPILYENSRCYLLDLPKKVLHAITKLSVRNLVPSTRDYDPFVGLPVTGEFARGCKRLANSALLHVCTQTRLVVMPAVNATMQALIREVIDENTFWKEVAAAFEAKEKRNVYYADSRARLRVENEGLVWHLYSQAVWDVHLGRQKTYCIMGGRSTKEGTKEMPRRLLDLPKELRLMIFAFVVSSSIPSARQADTSDALIPERDFEQRCALFSELALVHTCTMIRDEVFPMVFDALNALARALHSETSVWQGIRESLYGSMTWLHLASLDALQAILVKESRWSVYTNIAARTLVGWSLAWGDEEFRAVSLADAKATGHPACSRRYRKGGKKSAGMHYEDF
ncbi:hypothetical protein B0A48_11135 [Cryoendolithus antarcticus]|uniref:Uncharacterized protein n=1 Tax=Cryoendolithus antarcticus TaxID=1507870 RepID=A0A1V8SVE3_9PEZI|nr:hypothetical protein B0A48_11135 [Cryoendolithus antarcticus]